MTLHQNCTISSELGHGESKPHAGHACCSKPGMIRNPLSEAYKRMLAASTAGDAAGFAHATADYNIELAAFRAARRANA